MTRARTQVLECLSSMGVPASARQLSAQLGNEHDQATVYRALHYLEDKGYLDSFVLHCDAHGTERYFVLRPAKDAGPSTHRHWFHCEVCHRFTDLGQCHLDELVAQMGQERGLEIRAHTFYATGVCRECLSRPHSAISSFTQG